MNNETLFGTIRVGVAWLGLIIASVTLSQTVLLLTAVFTVLQIYKLLREIRRERRLEQLEAKLKHDDIPTSW